MLHRQIIIGSISIAVLLLITSLAQADFVADQFMTISQGTFRENSRIISARVYSQGKKLRVEMASMAGRNTISISRADKTPPVFWMLMPDEKIYMETTREISMTDPSLSKPDIKIEKVFVSKETIAGHPCNKFKLIWTDKTGKKRSGFAWEATDLNDAPIRQEFFDGNEHVLVQLANIEVKKLDPELFEVPSGYKKISLPPGMPGNPMAPLPK